LRFPEGEGLRIDTGVEEGDAVTPFYDPMIAKVIAHGTDRDEALDRLSAGLGETLVAGPKTNLAFLRALAEAPEFRAGRFDTGFIDQNLEALGALPRPPDPEAVRLCALRLLQLAQERDGAARLGTDLHSPWSCHDAFQLGGARRQLMPITVEGERQEVTLAWPEPGARLGGPGPAVEFGGGRSRDAELVGEDRYRFVATASGVIVVGGNRQTAVAPFDPFDVDLEHIDEGGVVKAPMHGKLVAVFVRVGDEVEKGQRLAILEAMKMEHALVAPAAGEVAEVGAEAGDQVAEGARLIVLKSEAAAEAMATAG
jgi:3-methylcrotonyl-CoA carboxylase alpha subunit